MSGPISKFDRVIQPSKRLPTLLGLPSVSEEDAEYDEMDVFVMDADPDEDETPTT